ncbi:helix-turn-helix domain-containing protein [Terrimesophilobacter mesophilus]|uniref:helix-turn-helix domain-containing protein n=1 Tax=Terrimesophilobacter mesophilus TaxID=433647 RepID=UPI001425669B|nr:helix-turn-helix domain-containing protein [Terrimesophilobacter mesophilus]
MVDLSTADADKWVSLLKLLHGSIKPQSAPDYEGVALIRQRQRRLTTAEAERMIERYKDGVMVHELAAEFGCHRTTITERLKSAGVKIRLRAATTKQVNDMIRLYESGLSMEKVADEVGISARTVFNYLKQRGVATRDAHGRKRPSMQPHERKQEG